MSQERFWISTGDIKEAYQPLNVVATKAAVDAPAFGRPDYAKGFRLAVDELAQSAVKLGANGVIWINFTPLEGTFGFAVYASGTAVKVTSA